MIKIRNAKRDQFLFQIGKNQHYELGQWLRQRYSSLLDSSYSSSNIYVHSTDVDRAIMSAESNLAGLFPPTNQQIWNKNIMWQPIPIHTIPRSMDYVLAFQKSCPAFDEELSAVRNSEEFMQLDERLSNLYEYLTKHTGTIVNTIEAIQRINNTLTIEVIYNKT